MKNLTIKVGDYVRTKDGVLWKPEKIEIDEDNCYIFDDYYFYEPQQIYKSSSNIIDLIEIGDMVKVEDFGWVRVSIKFETLKFFDADGTEWLYDEIESIVTKEQMKAMEYKIER